MMGRQSRQMAMVFEDIESLIPETHLLRKIDAAVDFARIYELVEDLYCAMDNEREKMASTLEY